MTSRMTFAEKQRSFLLALALLSIALVSSQSASAQAAAVADTPALKVNVDISQTPELADWAQQAKSTVEEWHPRIAKLLPSDGFTPPAEITLFFQKDMKGVAHTSGNKITISAEWVKKHPDDLGMVVHELTHVIQSYPRSDAGWLVEGIADYIRLYHYEPKVKLSGIDPARQSYRDGYRTTALFLAWIQRTQDEAIIRKLNHALRRSEYNYAFFKQCTSKSLDRLWAEFLEDEAARGR